MQTYKRILGPLVLFVFVGTSLLASHFGLMPQLSVILNEFFLKFGLFVLPLVVTLEYTYGLNIFFPGAFTIVFAMSVTIGNTPLALLTFFIIWFFSLTGCFFSYKLGKLEAHSINISVPLVVHSGKIRRFISSALIFFAYAHPLTASIRGFQRGVDCISLSAYLRELILLNLIWNIFWGLLSYRFAGFLSEGDAFSFIILGYSIIWLWRELRILYGKRES